MDLREEIRKLTESKLTEGQFIVDVVVTSRQGPKKVLVTVDADESINIDDCAEISRQLSKSLDEAALFDDPYHLEVSTPGVDQPLKLKRQYKKNVGRNVKVQFRGEVIEGKLSEVQDDNIILEHQTGSGKKKEVTKLPISFSEIEKAIVLVSFK